MKQRLRSRIVTAGLAALLAVTILLPAPAAGAESRNGRIAFSRDGDVYTIRADGTGLRRVTDHPAYESAVWSPDGRKLAVVRCCEAAEAGWRLLVMRPDGTHRVRISRRVASSIQWPVWSPDGRAVAYVDYDIDNSDLPAPYPGAIRVARADGSRDVRLTGYGTWNVSPAWSPDGRWIAFTSHRDGDSDVYVMRHDGTRLRKVTHNKVNDTDPEWSPDGSSIAFTSDAPAADSFTQWVSVMRRDGSHVQELTPRTQNHRALAWAPDGRRLLVERSVGMGEQPPQVTLMAFDADSGASREIVSGQGMWGGAWSPDGRRVIYTRDDHIFTVAARGGSPMRLTRGAAPSWQARPAR